MKTKLFNIKANKRIRRELRQQDIACEKIIWSKIRNNQIGYKFRRQYSISNFIVDLYCPKLKLVIEIDGVTHGTGEEIKYDKFRQKFLENQGLIVKRYLNIDIKENLEAFLSDLQETCEELNKKLLKPTSPNLSL